MQARRFVFGGLLALGLTLLGAQDPQGGCGPSPSDESFIPEAQSTPASDTQVDRSKSPNPDEPPPPDPDKTPQGDVPVGPVDPEPDQNDGVGQGPKPDPNADDQPEDQGDPDEDSTGDNAADDQPPDPQDDEGEQNPALCFRVQDGVSTLVVRVGPEFNEGDALPENALESPETMVTVNAQTVQTVDGVATFEGLPPGTVTIELEDGTTSFVEIRDTDALVEFAMVPGAPEQDVVLRFPRGARVIELGPDDDISAAAREDNVIIMLGAGEFVGPVTIEGAGVVLIGACSRQRKQLQTTIAGDLVAPNICFQVRGVNLFGELKIAGSAGSASFVNSESIDVAGDNIVLFANRVSAGNISAAGNGILLFDNSASGE